MTGFIKPLAVVRPAAAAVASDDVEMIGELIHLVSPLLRLPLKAEGLGEADWAGRD
jgi:hypothetical protein